MPIPPVPELDMARVADAHARLLQAIDGLDDEAVRRPSALAGWTVGHVLTHLARNADSHVRRAEGAERGEVVTQYEGGTAGRAFEIEAGASRAARVIVDDVRRSADAVRSLWASLPVRAWRGRTLDTNGLARPLLELPGRRWQEVEVHLVDLVVGPTWRDWSDEFVVAWLPRVREFQRAVLLELGDLDVFDEPADELAWLFGRMDRPDLPRLPGPW